MKKKFFTTLMVAVMLSANFTAVPVSAAAESDYYAYAPTANSYKSTGGEIALTWRNPQQAATKVTLYQINDDGSVTMLADDFAAEADKCITTVRTGLETGKVYRYKVVFEFADHEKTSTYFSSTADTFTPSNEKVGSTSWGRMWQVQVADENKASDLYIDPNVKKSGGYSLHVSNNWPTDENWKEQGSVLTFTPFTGDNAIVSGGTYRLKGDFKAEKYNPKSNFAKLGNQDIKIFLFDTDKVIESKDWTEFDRQMTTSASGSSISFYMTAFNVKDLWLDNLNFYNKDTATKNLFTGSINIGNFDNAGEVPAAIPEATGVQSGGDVTVTFKETPGGEHPCKKLYVYETVGNVDVTRGVLDPTDLTVNIEGVTGKLKTSNKNDRYVMSEKAPVTVEKEKTKADYYIQNPVITPKIDKDTNKSQIQLNWRNPSIKPVKVSVYDITNPKASALVKNDFDTTANAPISYTVENVTEGQQYVYKIVCEFENHQSTSSILSRYAFAAADNGTKDYAISGESWCVRTTGPQNASFVNIDTTQSHNGKASLHISNSADGGVSDLRFTDKKAAELTTGDKYEISFWIKAADYTQTGSMLMQTYQDGQWKYVKDAASPTVISEFEWTQVKIEYTVKDNYKDWPYLIIKTGNMKAKDIWIDDIAVKKINTGADYIPVATFENSIPAFEVTDAAVIGVGDQSAQISYTTPNGAQAVYVYEKDAATGELIMCANVSDLDSLNLDGLVNDAENEIVIKTLSADYVLSNGVTLTAKPKADAYRTGDYKLYSGSNEITGIAAGEMTVKLDVSNVSMGSTFKPCYIVALYNGDEMADYSVCDNINIAQGTTETLQASVTIPDGADLSKYQIKAFLWKDFEKMGVLKTCGEF